MMKVSGISRSLNEVIDAKIMKANTTPDAPKSPEPQKNRLIMAVTIAVAPITNKMRLLPYFSSNIGPTNMKSNMLLK